MKSKIEVWLVAYIAELRQVEPETVSVLRPFTSFGITSAEGVTLAVDLGKWLDVPLPATMAWDCPTIAGLASHLSGRQISSNAASSAGVEFSHDELEDLLSAIERLPEDEVPSYE